LPSQDHDFHDRLSSVLEATKDVLIFAVPHKEATAERRASIQPVKPKVWSRKFFA
jgi:hypothetical protein